MATLDAAEARTFADDWIAAWNARDIERVLSHYSEEIEFRSPFVISIAGEASGALRGKSPLRAYWTKALAMLPELHFELIDVLAGVGALTIYYRGHRGMVAETFAFNESQQVISAAACYSAVEVKVS